MKTGGREASGVREASGALYDKVWQISHEFRNVCEGRMWHSKVVCCGIVLDSFML